MYEPKYTRKSGNGSRDPSLRMRKRHSITVFADFWWYAVEERGELEEEKKTKDPVE